MNFLCLKTPIGNLQIEATDKYITSVKFLKNKKGKSTPKSPRVLKDCKKQLEEYFQGKRTKFSLPLSQEGTEFQKRVWSELKRIPYGKLRSYGEVAKKIGKPLASRAVGGANNKNSLPILIPCHRVVGSSGKLVGFAAGVSTKEWLLEHEGAL